MNSPSITHPAVPAPEFSGEPTTTRLSPAKKPRALTLACEVYAYSVHRGADASTSWRVSEIPPIKERLPGGRSMRAAELRVQIAEGVGSDAAAKTLRQIADQIEVNAIICSMLKKPSPFLVARAHEDDAE
jgi:hypothetical protein